MRRFGGSLSNDGIQFKSTLKGIRAAQAYDAKITAAAEELVTRLAGTSPGPDSTRLDRLLHASNVSHIRSVIRYAMGE
jgi:hypothetical protein